jgi:hypothetical protein
VKILPPSRIFDSQTLKHACQMQSKKIKLVGHVPISEGHKKRRGISFWIQGPQDFFAVGGECFRRAGKVDYWRIAALAAGAAPSKRGRPTRRGF